MANFEETCLLGPTGIGLRAQLDAEVVLGNAAAQLRRAELRMVQRDPEAAIEDVLVAGRSLQADRARGPAAELLAARLLNRTLRHDAASAVLAHARVKAGRGGPRTRLALAMAEAEILIDRKDLVAARSAYLRALPLTTHVAVAHERLSCLLALATISQMEGDPDGAMPPLGQALALSREHNDAPARAECAFALGNLHLRRNEADPSRQLLEEALATGALASAMAPVALSFLARIAINVGDHDAALRHAIEAAKAAAAGGNAGGFADGTLLAALAQERSGRGSAALKTLAAGERVLRERGETTFADLVLAERQRMESATT